MNPDPKTRTKVGQNVHGRPTMWKLDRPLVPQRVSSEAYKLYENNRTDIGHDICCADTPTCATVHTHSARRARGTYRTMCMDRLRRALDLSVNTGPLIAK